MAKQRPQESDGALAGVDDAIRCAVCEHVITSAAYRCEQAGAHEHTFVNPNGFVHHIGCFTAAPGCLHVGEPQEAFSWFPGWSWQIAVCGRCRAHLGWIFRLAPGEFHGLIVNAIRM
ncbi:MAG: cereblon family protein [Kofleriaceae bacterium]